VIAMDEVEEIKRRKLEKMLLRASQPKVEYPSLPVYVNESTLNEVVRK